MIHPRILIVEGRDDLYSVVNLMSVYIDWPENSPPVYIDDKRGIFAILEQGFLSTQIKIRTTEILGVLIDADDNLTPRFESIRHGCIAEFPDFPKQMSTEGLIFDNNESGKRFGLWMMPDNSSDGCLETFLACLVPEQSEPIWSHALDATVAAKDLGADYKHVDKANLHTWLAWQEPPGRPFGQALTAKMLDPKSGRADAFVNWFRRLYKLQPSGMYNQDVGACEELPTCADLE